MPHELIAGSHATGKSTEVKSRMARFARSYPDWSVVWIDPQYRASGSQFYQDCLAYGLDSRLLFERMSDTDAVIKQKYLVPSKAADKNVRDKEDKEEVEEFLDALGRQRRFDDLTEHAWIKQWSQNWANLMMHQYPRKPLAQGIWAFRPNSPSWEELCNDSEDEEAAREFRFLPTHPASLDRMVAPGKRFFDPIFNCPMVKLRDGMSEGFDINKALDEAKILIFEGGDLSEEEIGFLLRNIVLKVIRYKRKGGKTPVVVVLEEAEAYNLIGAHEAKAIKMLGKYGLVFIIICQTPLFLNEDITRDVMQNTQSHKWFRCEHFEVAALAAKDLQGDLDPWMIHHVDRRLRQRVRGFKAIRTESTTYRDGGVSVATRPGSSSSVYLPDGTSRRVMSPGSVTTTVQEPATSATTGIQYQPDYEDYIEETVQHMRLDDQERLKVVSVMGFDTGEFEHKYMGKIQHVVGEKPEDLWVWSGLGSLKAMRHHAATKRLPPFSKLELPDESRSPNGNGKKHERSGGSKTKATRRRSGKSAKLAESQVIKPVKETAGNGRKKGSSSTSAE